MPSKFHSLADVSSGFVSSKPPQPAAEIRVLQHNRPEADVAESNFSGAGFPSPWRATPWLLRVPAKFPGSQAALLAAALKENRNRKCAAGRDQTDSPADTAFRYRT